ncbi:Mannosyl-oligosaccharide 1-2-alpha-mannosidase [Penicillium taxi]|uniref:Mannosyl-oligosaccharide 1-2-alpha-mannosidase n=1 Tax=Penicillium taxi TaxID=168475 RepID=UPI002545062C|nr:Mannosyl-oligosaccharide 1-2-alpha-mannosidase [Penicillium taxi]KAJ5894367.1 Mannosyl-oligosaccharide 1-2-alpha-mannosidase [Penicillium taxi]
MRSAETKIISRRLLDEDIMSFQAPHSHPSSYSTQPRGALAGLGLTSAGSDLSNRVNNFFENEKSLPMYKDKPFAPRRTAPRKRWRTLFNILAICALLLLWYYKASLPYISGSISKSKGNDRGVALWNWMQQLKHESASDTVVNWDDCRDKVRDAFIVSWEGYEKDAWGYDEYNPASGNKKNMIDGGMGWMLVDALDAAIIMNLTSQVRHARQWISTSLQYNQDHDVSTFETTIRMLGGLLSAHYLSTKYPTLAPIADDDFLAAGEDLYIEKATDLADRLLGAFDTPTGIPYSSVNLNKSMGLRSRDDGGAASTAEATSVQLEFKYLAKLTGEGEYWRVAEKVMEVVDGLKAQDGLVPIFIHPDSGQFKGNNIRLGSRGDSYYEYLIKQYLQTSLEEPVYKEMWNESMQGIRKHLLSFSQDANLMVLGERPQGLEGALSPKMDHLVCFMPGTIALGATGGIPLADARESADWTQQKEDEILISRELMKTCWATYLQTKTGLAPEISHFILDSPPVMMEDKYPDPKSDPQISSSIGSPPHELASVSLPLSPLPDGTEPWRKDIEIHHMDTHNLQRPETVESLFYMYRVTGDEIYRKWGWEMFKSFVNYTSVIEHDPSKSTLTLSENAPITHGRVKGFTSLGDVTVIPPAKRDNMESFWMAETLKYFYLLFSDRDFISLEDHIFNTEAHPMPRFKLGGELKTGWQRKPRPEST